MYQHNKVFAAACIALLLFGIILITLGSILPLLTAKFTISDLNAGKLVSLLPIGILAGSLIFGPVVDRYGYKILLIASVVLSVFSLEGLVLTRSFLILQICIFGIGIGGGILHALRLANSKHPRAIGIIHIILHIFRYAGGANGRII